MTPKERMYAATEGGKPDIYPVAAPYEMLSNADHWQELCFVAGYMYRFAEINLDFDTLLQNGIDGMIEIINGRLLRAENQSVRNFCGAMIDIMELARECCIYYAVQAEDMIKYAGADYAKTLIIFLSTGMIKNDFLEQNLNIFIFRLFYIKIKVSYRRRYETFFRVNDRS